MFFIHSMLGAVYHMTQYVAIRFIPLGVSGCILRTVLMISITLMARFVLKELLTVVKITAVAVSLLGTFLVIQPGGIFVDDPDVISDYPDVNTTVSPNNLTESPKDANNMEDIYGYLLTCAAGLVYYNVQFLLAYPLNGRDCWILWYI